MISIKKLSFPAIFLGFISLVASTIALSFLNLIFFSGLLTKDASLDILLTSKGPLVFSLFVLFVSALTGLFVASRVAGYRSLLNSICVVFVYALFSYFLSQSPSNLEKPYPSWFTFSSYILLIPAVLIGHYILKFGQKKNA